nr:DNA cytosine methyltransferase [Treponema succinifaciens]
MEVLPKIVYSVFVNDLDSEKTSFIDLFCGCGGFTKGFSEAGFSSVFGIDVWKDATVTYKHNFPNSVAFCGDIKELSSGKIFELTKLKKNDIPLIIGGPPCQGFSVAGKRIVDDERNKLYKSFVRLVDEIKPKVFVMENVPNILSIGDGIVKESVLNDFTEIGYNVAYKILTASDYGVPQARRRAFFVGLNKDIFGEEKFEFPESQNTCVTSLEALSDLPEDSVLDGTNYFTEAKSDYQKLMRQNSQKIYNHEITQHSEQTKKIIALVPDGGNYKNLPLDLQQTRKVHIAWTRLNSNKPSFTIDTGHRHHFHYKWNRIPTVRESARLQSFPDDFVFIGTKTSQYKQVGNAVPPLLAKAIANKIMEMLNV